MLVTKLKIGAALVMMVGALFAGAGWAAHQVLGQTPAEELRKDEPKFAAKKPDDAKGKKLKEIRADSYGDPLPAEALVRLGTLRQRIPGGEGGYHFPADSGTILIYRKGLLRWLDRATWRENKRWQLADGLAVVSITQDGKHVVTRDAKTLQLWDLESQRSLQEFEGINDREQVSAWSSPDGKTLVTVHGANYTLGFVRVWDISSRKELWHEGVMANNFDGLMPLGFSADGKVLILNNNKDNRITLRDLKTGKEIRSFATMPRKESRCYALSPDGSTVMIGNAGSSVRSWDVATGKENVPLGGHKEQAFSAAFSGDGRQLWRLVVLLRCRESL
jgi:hypothetical protein